LTAAARESGRRER